MTRVTAPALSDDANLENGVRPSVVGMKKKRGVGYGIRSRPASGAVRMRGTWRLGRIYVALRTSREKKVGDVPHESEKLFVYSVKGMRVVKESGGEKRLKVEFHGEFASRHRFTECAGLLLLEIRVFFVFALDGGVNVSPCCLRRPLRILRNMAFEARF